MAEKVFLNDKIVDSSEALIPANDGGFLYGAGVFETMRSHNGIVFCIEDHLDRLFENAQKLSILNTYDRKYIKDAIYSTLDANSLTDARMRLTLTSGPMSGEIEQRKSTLLISAINFTPYPGEYYSKGITVILSPYKQIADDPAYGVKSLNYFSRILALNLAHHHKCAEAIWFTTENYLAEGSVSNIFVVKDSKVYTPPLDTPVLPGIARKTVLKIAADNKIDITEKSLSIDDLLNADEVFVTNVIMQVMPVTGIEKHTVADGKIGTITKKLAELYSDYLNENCKK